VTPAGGVVLVTGASGFLGRALVPRLKAAGYRVTALGNTRRDSPFGAGVEYLAGDLARADAARALLSPWRWDAVANLAGPVAGGAAPVSDADSLADHSRVIGSLLAALPEGWRGRFVHVSSMTVYGLPEVLPVSETHPLRPLHAYGEAKRRAEAALLDAPRRPGDAWVLRMPGLFSAGRRSGALYHFVRAARSGADLAVQTEPAVPWDVLHVDDAARAVVGALASPARDPGAVNVAYGERVQMVELAERLAARGGSRVVRRGAADPPAFAMDVSKAAGLFAWPPATLEQRLDELWAALAEPEETMAGAADTKLADGRAFGRGPSRDEHGP
jgi:UDP-glucose 4-epimerase